MPESIFKLKIFNWIDKEVVEDIIVNSEEKEFKTWEMILTEWDSSNWEWYIIKNGRVSISIKWQKIAELSNWDMVWEISLLNEEQRTASVKAIEDSEVIILTLDSLINMINHDDNSINKEIIRRIEENLRNA